MGTRDIKHDLNVPKLGHKMQELTRKYMERLNEHPNSLARKLNLTLRLIIVLLL